MKKKFLLVLIVYFVIQLAFPGYLLYKHYNVLLTGERYKFEVKPYDPYDPFRGRYVTIRAVLELNSDDGQYALFEKDENGYAVINGFQQTKPETANYAKNMKLDRYYMNEKMAPEAERIQRKLDSKKDRVYVLVAVKNGGYVIQGLYVNDVTVEKYLTDKGLTY